MNWDIQYGALAQDADFVNRYDSIKEGLIELQSVLHQVLPMRARYDKMSLPEKIEYDLFLAYTMNSLHWIHLRILGIDPNETPIKDELNRCKTAMRKWQEIKDKSKKPTIDIKAAKRFINSGLYDRHQGFAHSMNKRIKFNDDE